MLSNSKKLLPLDASAYQHKGSLAVIGPNSDLVAYGNYAGHNDNNTTPVQGLQRVVPDLVRSATVAYMNATCDVPTFWARGDLAIWV